MNLNDYQSLARQTSKFATNEPLDPANITMALLGLCGEVGELADMYKKHLYHGHQLDRGKVFLELGDILWYVAEATAAFGYELELVAESNIAKLKHRYGKEFSTEASINRKEE